MKKGVQRIAAVLIILPIMLSGCAQNNRNSKNGFSNIHYVSSDDRSILSKLESSKIYIEDSEIQTGRLSDLVQSQFYSSLLDLGGTTIEIGNEDSILTIKLEATEFNGKKVTADDVILSITDAINEESSPYRVLSKYVRRDTSGNIQNIIKNSDKSITIKFQDDGIDTRFLEIPITYASGEKINLENKFESNIEYADLELSGDKKTDEPKAYIAKTDTCYGIACSDLGDEALRAVNSLVSGYKEFEFTDGFAAFNLSFDDLAVSLYEQQQVKSSLSSICTVYTNGDKIDGIKSEDIPSTEIDVGITKDALWLKSYVNEMLVDTGYKANYIELNSAYSDGKFDIRCDLIIDYSWIYSGAFPSTQISEVDNIFKSLNRVSKCQKGEKQESTDKNDTDSSKVLDHTKEYKDIQPLFTTAWYLYDIPRGGK